MTILPEIRTPLMALGMTSFVLGLIGLSLFFLPILAIPLATFGLFFGLLGLGEGLVGARSALRWSLFGVGFSLLALAVGVAIALAPWGYSPRHGARQPQEPPGVPYVPPAENPVMK